MYKSYLQNLCQVKQWKLPEYEVRRSGADHNPTFTATVTVNGVHYNSDDLCFKAKEAQKSAAKVAFNQLNSATATATASACAPPLNPLITSTPSSSSSSSGLCIEGPSTQTIVSSSTVKDEKKFIDAQNLYKNRLQSYALKKSLKLPEYSCEREGLPHAPRFKCKVTFQGKTIESSEFHSTLKEAEQEAAKCAWESLSLDETQQDDSALYKNLLQEYLQKKGFVVPKYEIISSGPAHMPVYVAKVNIQGKTYEGKAASVKKLAESYAAKVAYLGLQDQQRKEAEEHIVSCEQQIERQEEQRKEAEEHIVSCEQQIERQEEQRKEAEEHIVSCEQQIERQEVYTSGSHIKEALEVSSSILQSIIAADVQLRATPNSNLPATAEKRDEYTVSDEAPPSSPEAAKSAKRLCLPSSDSVHHVAYTPSNTNNAYLQVGSSDTRRTTDETITVHPRKPNMTIPPGSLVFPLSDDQWVALKTLPDE